MRSAVARHDVLIETLVNDHRGHVVRPRGEGDSRFAVFRRATDGVEAAAGIQLAFVEESWPSNEPLRVRMALHTGEADLRTGDYYGPAVNHCARLRAVAHGGQVVVSSVTADLVREGLAVGVGLRDLGEHQLKDLAQPEHVWQLVHPSLRSEFPPLVSQRTTQHNLPTHLSSFIGREQDLHRIQRLIDQNRLVTLTGVGGMGKTRLALQLAEHLVTRFSGGVWLVDLAALSDPELVPATLANTLRVAEKPPEPLRRSLEIALRSRRLLLVLDNCEHVIEVCTELADSLLRACPDLRIIATSRQPLRVDGEVVWRVPPLALPERRGNRTTGPVDALESDAIQLFVERAQAADATFETSDRSVDAVVEVCRRLDGVPLAIELAASMMRVLSVDQILARLSDRFKLLAYGSRTSPTRQRTLRATIDWSYDLLRESEQTLLLCMSVFAGGWSIDAAEAISGVTRVQSDQVLELLTGLIDKSMVRRERDQNGTARFRLLDTMRDYAAERLRTELDAEAVRRSHAQFFFSLAGQADAHLGAGARQHEWLVRLDSEHDNLRAALQWYNDRGETYSELQLAFVLGRFWRRRGHLSEGRARLSGALARADDAPSALRAQALNELAAMESDQADYDSAEMHLSESLRLFRALGDRSGLATVLNGLAFIARNRDNDRARASQMYGEMLEIAREIGADRLIASGQINAAAVDIDDGNLERATQRLDEAARLLRKLEARDGYAYCLQRLASISWLTGDYAGLRDRAEQAVAIFRELGHKVGLTWGLLYLGRGAYETGDFPRARSLLLEALALSRELEANQRAACALQVLGSLSLEEGDLEAAREHLEQSRAIGRDFTAAMPQYRAATSVLAQVEWTQGNVQGASDLYGECLDLLAQVTDRHEFPVHFEAIARMFVSLERPQAAARLLGAADVLRKSLSMPLPPIYVARHAQAVADARAANGTAFDREWAAGVEMSIQQVLAHGRDVLTSLGQAVRKL
jgi:predicted ATPase